MSQAKRCVCVALLTAAFCAPAGAQILLDGNMDSLAVGTPPDNGVPAGAWGFPAAYAGVVDESGTALVSIVATSSFDAGASGNSLALDYNNDPNAWNLHLPNVFTSVINESPGVIVTTSFDVFIPAGFDGGSVYVGGDHGGGGFSNASDRGPQITFYADGRVTWTATGAVETQVATYAHDAWFSVRWEIDLSNDTYDMFFGPRGGTLTQVGDNLTFRSVALDHLDRFTRVCFGANTLLVHAFIDNVSVTVPGAPCPGDLDGDHDVDLQDLATLLAHFGATGPGLQGDIDGDGDVDLQDLATLLAHFGTTCVSAGEHRPPRLVAPRPGTGDPAGP